MTDSDRSTPSRLPQQQRSRETVDAILAAAGEAFADHGSANVTTTQIAALAHVSVGALYRFFADKEAIKSALAERYLADAGPRFDALLGRAGTAAEIPDVLADVIAEADQLALRHRGYYQLTRELAPSEAASAGAHVRTVMIDAFEQMLDRVAPGHATARRRTTITLLIETVRNTLAIAPPPGAERSRLVAELTDLVVEHARRQLTGGPARSPR